MYEKADSDRKLIFTFDFEDLQHKNYQEVNQVAKEVIEKFDVLINIGK